jgi:hypothetical protein
MLWPLLLNVAVKYSIRTAQEKQKRLKNTQLILRRYGGRGVVEK